MRSYFDGMLRYFEFSGCSTRMQYWMFFLVQMVLFCVAIAVDYRMGGFANAEHPQLTATLFVGFVHLVPGVTVQVRRLHDIGKSGAWYLLGFLPLGGLVLLYWACRPSEPGHHAHVPSYARQVSGRSTIPRAITWAATGPVRPQSGATGWRRRNASSETKGAPLAPLVLIR